MSSSTWAYGHCAPVDLQQTHPRNSIVMMRSTVLSGPRQGGRQAGRQLWWVAVLSGCVVVLRSAGLMHTGSPLSSRVRDLIERPYPGQADATGTVGTRSSRVIARIAASPAAESTTPPPPPRSKAPNIADVTVHSAMTMPETQATARPRTKHTTKTLETLPAALTLSSRTACVQWRLVWFTFEGWEGHFVPNQLLAKVPLAPSRGLKDARLNVRDTHLEQNIGPLCWHQWIVLYFSTRGPHYTFPPD
jgi:hypothetical protein